MKRNISEDLPARQHPPAASGGADKQKSSDDKKEQGKTPDERVRQAVYDIRYRARREELPLLQAYSQYMQNSSMPQQEKMEVKEKLFGKEQSTMKAEDFNIQDFASSNVADALYKVFVEKVQEKEPIVLTYMEKLESAEGRKYKVKVTGTDGRSYVRYATRSKISQLRSNPNIDSVEMTGYGDAYEGEKSKKDYDGDGKIESGAKEYRGAVHNAIQRKKGGVPDGKDTSNVKEEFIDEVNTTDLLTGKKSKQIGLMSGKNNVKISPNVPGTGRNETQRLQMAHYDMNGSFVSESENSDAYKKFLDNLQEKKLTKKEKAKKEEIAKALKPKYGKTSKTYAIATSVAKKVAEETECEKDEKEMDSRSIPTKVNLAKYKLRAMGLKMNYEPEGEVIDERRREERGEPRRESEPIVQYMKKKIRETEGTPEGQRKKKRGAKPPAAGEPGSERRSPEQIIAARRSSSQKARELMSSPRD